MSENLTRVKFDTEQNKIKISALKKHGNEVKSLITTNQNSIAAVGSRLASAESSISSQQTRLNTAESTISTHGTRLTTAESNITSLTTQVANISSSSGGGSTTPNSACTCDRTYNVRERFSFNCSTPYSHFCDITPIQFICDPSHITTLNISFKIETTTVNTKTINVTLNGNQIFTCTEAINNETKAYSLSHTFMPSQSENKIEIEASDPGTTSGQNVFLAIRQVCIDAFGRNIMFLTRNNDFYAKCTENHIAYSYIGADNKLYYQNQIADSSFDFSLTPITVSLYGTVPYNEMWVGIANENDHGYMNGMKISYADNTLLNAIRYASGVKRVFKVENPPKASGAYTLVLAQQASLGVVQGAYTYFVGLTNYNQYDFCNFFRYDDNRVTMEKTYSGAVVLKDFTIQGKVLADIGGSCCQTKHIVHQRIVGTQTETNGETTLFIHDGTNTQLVSLGKGAQSISVFNSTTNEIRTYLKRYGFVVEYVLNFNQTSGEHEISAVNEMPGVQFYLPAGNGARVERRGNVVFYYASPTSTEPTSTLILPNFFET